MNVCVITYSSSKAFIVPLNNLGFVLAKQGELWLIIPERVDIRNKINVSNVNVIEIKYDASQNVLRKAYNRLNMEMKTAIEIVRLRNRIDMCLVSMEGCALLPTLISRLLHKRTMVLLPSNIAKYLGNGFFNKIRKISNTAMLNITDYIVVYSPSLVMQWDLELYRHKILIAHRHFLDFKTFTVTTPLSDRPPLIGYIGRLSGEKGVQHFAQALPTILSDRQDLRVLIGGDGAVERVDRSLPAGEGESPPASTFQAGSPTTISPTT